MKTFFEASIWPLRSKLYRMAYLWLKDRDEAEDAVQEALEKAWSNRDTLQKLGNPTGWLVKVLKNQSLQKIREHKRWAILGEGDELPEVEEAPAESSSPALQLVFRFLKELPEKQQEIFQLREVEGLTYEEISEYLDISMEQVKVNLFRARKKPAAVHVKKPKKMKEKIETLLSKYYGGETTLSEERELRELLLEVDGFEAEKQFFLGLEVVKVMVPSARPLPSAKGEIRLWQKVAAVMAVFLSLTWLFVDHQMKKEEAMAYAQVMEAFDLIQENMLKGTESLRTIQDMRHLNKTNEMFNINQKKKQ